MSTPTGPNTLRVAWSILRARRRRPPAPTGSGTVEHGALAPILEKLREGGVPALGPLRGAIDDYRSQLEAVDPDTLARNEALAFWMNLYNAGALAVAAETFARGESSVLRMPGAFDRPWARVAGESLSLDDIEHGKIRRFRDPRIHGALVCGSASCPTLRYEPYRGIDVDGQLDDQMHAFLTGGGAVADRSAGVLSLSRVFLWYGGDFSRPHRMPTWLPARKPVLVAALRPWLDAETRDWVDTAHPKIEFQTYDWSLACRIN